MESPLKALVLAKVDAKRSILITFTLLVNEQ